MRAPRVFASRRSRRRTVAYLLVVLVAWIGLTLLARRELEWLLDPVALREVIRGFGVLAPLAFLALQAGQVVVAPVPGHVLGLAAGYLFGVALGTAVSVAGATVGSYVAFRISRRYGRGYVERTVDPEFLDTFDSVVEENGLRTLFLVFLIPGLPDDVICFVAGLTELDIGKMVLVSALGRIPGYLLVAAAGAGLAAGRALEAGGIILALVAATALVYLQRDRVLARLGADDRDVHGGG